MKPRKAGLYSLAFSALIGVLWAFPSLWYSRTAMQGEFVWLGEENSLAGWQFEQIPIAKSAEALLVTDRTVNGEFKSDTDPRVVRVLSAKRYRDSRNQESLLRHTPDACCVDAGWKMEPAEPEFLDCAVHGVTIRCERRLFKAGEREELVYFGALMGGKPLSFRLDQYRNAGAETTENTRGSLTKWLRQKRYWGMAWDSFANRTAFGGPQQFIRISTPVQGNDLAAADALLGEFLPQWLQRTDYQKEYEDWKTDSRKTKD